MDSGSEGAHVNDDEVLTGMYLEAGRTRPLHEAPYDAEAELQTSRRELAGADATASSAIRGAGEALRQQRGPLVRSARRLMHTAVINFRRPTFWARSLPRFLIVGGQRCGTTSLTRTLSGHPAVFGPLVHREVHYFDVAFQRGIGWYRSNFPLTLHRQLAARAAGVPPTIFESSPYYMFHPLAPERIHRVLPGVKLLVLLRDPVERAYSAHTHEMELGYEAEPFERAIELESLRLEGEVDRIVANPTYYSHSHQHHSYRTRGQYIEQLERLEKIFGRDRIHVLDSDNYFADPSPLYDEVLNFLELPRVGLPDFKKQNARPRSASIPESVRTALRDHYRPYDERLAAWLGHEPSWCR
jgi:hypothetical protein